MREGLYMEVGDRPHVLVACSYMDDLRSVLRERLAEVFDAVPFELPAGSLAAGLALLPGLTRAQGATPVPSLLASPPPVA